MLLWWNDRFVLYGYTHVWRALRVVARGGGEGSGSKVEETAGYATKSKNGHMWAEFQFGDAAAGQLMVA